MSNAEEYLKTRRAMDIVGISHDDQVKKVLLYMLLFLSDVTLLILFKDVLNLV